MSLFYPFFNLRNLSYLIKFPLRMLNELVEKIEVYHAEKQDGVWEKSRYPKFCPLPARK